MEDARTRGLRICGDGSSRPLSRYSERRYRGRSCGFGEGELRRKQLYMIIKKMLRKLSKIVLLHFSFSSYFYRCFQIDFSRNLSSMQTKQKAGSFFMLYSINLDSFYHSGFTFQIFQYYFLICVLTHTCSFLPSFIRALLAV